MSEESIRELIQEEHHREVLRQREARYDLNRTLERC